MPAMPKFYHFPAKEKAAAVIHTGDFQHWKIQAQNATNAEGST